MSLKNLLASAIMAGLLALPFIVYFMGMQP